MVFCLADPFPLFCHITGSFLSDAFQLSTLFQLALLGGQFGFQNKSVGLYAIFSTGGRGTLAPPQQTLLIVAKGRDCSVLKLSSNASRVKAQSIRHRRGA